MSFHPSASAGIGKGPRAAHAFLAVPTLRGLGIHVPGPYFPKQRRNNLPRKKPAPVLVVEPKVDKPRRIGGLPRDPLTGKPLNPMKGTPPGKQAARSLSNTAQVVFKRLGGANWLKRTAAANPKEFLAFMTRVTDEGSDAPGGSYVPFVVPVEQRETIGGSLEPLSTDSNLDPLT